MTAVNQDLNRGVADVAYDMAEVSGGKVYLLNVVLTVFDGAGLVAAGPMMTSIPSVSTYSTQIIEDRTLQVAECGLQMVQALRPKLRCAVRPD
ncbi:hypothetical protein [Octadecabacter antarcticus]|uniref:hypothetical protein n=1 Tax=Octadecabacter antarcticus TaxID=1217908 RepID=UPI001181B4A2|nr:hypothetical protein [Octadecabacter antarcticus]